MGIVESATYMLAGHFFMLLCPESTIGPFRTSVVRGIFLLYRGREGVRVIAYHAITPDALMHGQLVGSKF